MGMLDLFDQHQGNQRMTLPQIVRGLCKRIDDLQAVIDQHAEVISKLRLIQVRHQEIIRAMRKKLDMEGEVGPGAINMDYRSSDPKIND